MNKMYLQHDCGGYGLLITDGVNWFYWDEARLGIRFDEHDEDARLSDELNAEKIRTAIKNGEFYDADDFVHECENEDDFAEHVIAEYRGLTLSDIDYKENYTEDTYSGDVHPIGHDETIWIEI